MKKRRRLSAFRVALLNLGHQKFRTLSIMGLVFCLTFSCFVGDIFIKSMDGGIKSTSERIGADIVVVPKNYVSSIENSLFLGKPCTVNFDREWIEKVSSVEGVGRVTPQLYLATLGEPCCDSEIQLIAFDQNSDFIIGPWINTYTKSELGPDEIILGSNIGKSVGDTVTYLGKEFKIVAKLDTTGMGYDASAFISFEAAYEISEHSSYANYLPFKDGRKAISMVLVEVEVGYGLSEVEAGILGEYKDSDILVYKTNELLKDFSKNLQNIRSYNIVLKFLLLLMAVISLVCIFTLTLHLRRREFGILSSLGTTRGKMMHIVLTEVALTCILGSLAAILLASGILMPFNNLIRSKLEVPYLLPDIPYFILLALKNIFLSVGVGIISSLYALIRLAKKEGSELIRED